MLRKLLDGGIRCVSARAAESISKRARSTVRDDLARLHAGPLRSSQKTYRIEKIRFLKPDVAVERLGIGSAHAPAVPTTESLTRALERSLCADVADKAAAVAPLLQRDGAAVAARCVLN